MPPMASSPQPSIPGKLLQPSLMYAPLQAAQSEAGKKGAAISASRPDEDRKAAGQKAAETRCRIDWHELCSICPSHTTGIRWCIKKRFSLYVIYIIVIRIAFQGWNPYLLICPLRYAIWPAALKSSFVIWDMPLAGLSVVLSTMDQAKSWCPLRS